MVPFTTLMKGDEGEREAQANISPVCEHKLSLSLYGRLVAFPNQVNDGLAPSRIIDGQPGGRDLPTQNDAFTSGALLGSVCKCV